MARLVLKAKQFAAEAVVPEQRLPDLALWLTAVSDGRAPELSPLLQLARVIRFWCRGQGVALLTAASSIFCWRFSQTGPRGETARHPWRHRSAVALAAGLFAISFIAPVHAQSYPAQYVATVWQTEQGLPQNSVTAMVQDREGYLWLATTGGLARFDGVRFRVFGGDDFPSLQSSRFQSLYASRFGELWIGTRNGGLIRLHGGIVTTYLERDGLPSRNVRSIREDAEGKLWINTISGIACCAGGRLQAYTTYSGKPVSEFFLQARDGSMWFRSGTDVVRFGADGSSATLAGGFMVQEARDGSVWVAFQNQPRLVRYHQGVFSDVALPAAGVRQWAAADRWQGVAMVGDPRQAVLAMATDTDGELLLLTPAGLVRAADGRLSPPESLPLPANIGDVPKVLSLMVDREGNRWVGTVGRGLFRFRRAPLTAYGKNEGLSDSPFRAVFQDRDGRIWLGGDAGVYWFDGHQFHLVPGLAEIGTIAQTKDGDLWFGGSGAVYRWRSGVLARFRIESPSVFQILQDREGVVWIVAPTYEQKWRLCRFRDGEFEQIDADVVQITEDRGGGLWLGGVNPPALRFVRGGKTVRYDQKQGMPPNGVHSFFQEPSGALWFSTTTGLYRLRDGRIGAITARNGLTTEVTSILDDGKGTLWLPSEQGIFRLSLKQVNDVADGKISSIAPFSYGIAEGMATSECNGGIPGACKARDGRLWFPTMRGVVAIDPNAVNGPPPVVLEEAWAKKVKLGYDSRTSVPAGSDTLDFTFTALDLSASERQRFRYRLEPFDKAWVEAGTRRTAHYTNMPPGEYSFRVIAANSYGIWNDRGASVRFALRPYFYQTNWFYALCATGFLAVLWAAYQFRLRQLQRAFKQLQDVIETIPAMAWTALPDGSNAFVNRRWAEYTGLSAEETAGSGWTAAVHPEDRQLYGEKWRASLAAGEPFEFEARFRCVANGEYRWFLGRGVPLRDRHGKILRWYGILTDIEDRRRAEQTLRESETRFRTLSDHAPDAILVYDFELGTIVDVNPQACEGLGYTRQELLGTDLLAFHPDLDREAMESVAERAAAGETVFDTHWHRRKDGTVFPVEVHTSLYCYGGRRYLLKIARDIGDRLRAEEAVRRSEEQLRKVIDTIPAFVWSASPDGSVDFINRRMLEFSGSSSEEAFGFGWKAAIHIEDRDHYLEVQRAAVASGQAFDVEARLRRADGQYRWLLFHSVPLYDETGTVVKRYGVSTDIDDRKRAEQALRRSEAYLADAQRLTQTGSWAWDPATREAFYWSEEMFRIFGFDPQKEVPDAKAFLQRIHPDDFDHTYEVLMKATGGSVDYEHEHRILLPDGTVKHIHAIGHPVLDQSGRVVEYVGTAVDITQNKRAEEALHRAEGYLVEAQRLTHTGAWATDARPQPLYWSQELFRLYGFEPQQGFPTHDEAVQRVHPEDRDRYAQAFHRVIHQKVDSDVEFRTVLPDGTIRHLYGLGHPILNTHGDVVEIVGTTVDITERKRAEEERATLRQLEADLAHINRVSMMGELAASIAHEVNQPLSGIVSNGSACLRFLAVDPPDMEEVREAVRDIVRDGKRAGEVIARIRALTKRAATPQEKLDLNETIREVLAIVGDEAKRKSVTIQARLEDDVFPVLGDRVQLQQVLLNLAMNALEAMSSVADRERHLVITSRNIDPDQVQVSVQDSGTGLNPDTVGRIFDPFHTTKPGGMGMGLSISRSILQNHSGRLWATANQGPGASFHFTLPKYNGGESDATVAGV
jgi:PAS domain S-box-containing protein